MVTPRFDSAIDLAPIPFDERVCRLALEMKKSGLVWQPHVGCFVWDPDRFMRPASPFPGRVYFILSLARFINIFGSIEEIAAKLVWLPTWHQSRLLCRQLGIDDQTVLKGIAETQGQSPCEELLHVYRTLTDRLRRR
jgi:hypothetical protein